MLPPVVTCRLFQAAGGARPESGGEMGGDNNEGLRAGSLVLRGLGEICRLVRAPYPIPFAFPLV